MKKFKALILSLTIAVMMFAAVGCKTSIPTVQTLHDSIYVTKTVTVTDTVFKTTPAGVSVSFPCDSIKKTLNPVSKQFKNARITITEKDGVVTADCYCDTVAIKAQLQHVFETEYRARSQLSTITKTEQYTPKFTLFLAWSGAVFWIILIVFIIIKYFVK